MRCHKRTGFLVFRDRKTGLPVLAFVQAGQSGGQYHLRGEGRVDKAGEDSAIAYLRRDDFIDGQQGTLAKVRFLRIRIGVGGSRVGGFAVEVGGIVVAAAIDDLCSKPGEQRLGTFRAVN